MERLLDTLDDVTALVELAKLRIPSRFERRHRLGSKEVDHSRPTRRSSRRSILAGLGRPCIIPAA
jgi:hypothetical protein